MLLLIREAPTLLASSFSAAVLKFFHVEFSKVLQFTSIFKANVFAKFSDPWKRCLWVRANNPQRIFKIFCWNQVPIKEKINPDLSKSVRAKKSWSSSNFSRAKRHEKSFRENLRKNSSTSSNCREKSWSKSWSWPNRRKKPRLWRSALSSSLNCSYFQIPTKNIWCCLSPSKKIMFWEACRLNCSIFHQRG